MSETKEEGPSKVQAIQQIKLLIKFQCDTAQPSCARCKRLGLDCTGGGQRRFKFIQVEDAIVSKRSSTPQTPPDAVIKVKKPLSNDMTWLANSLISGLEVKDPRFDLACYGTFLPEIPRRLGKHPALDASASALVCAYPAVYSRQPSREALTRYGHALHVLRTSLDNPNSENVVETLCAIYFLLICQVCIPRTLYLSILIGASGLDCKARRSTYQSW